MRKEDVQCGGEYVAKVSGKLTVIKIVSESRYGGWNGYNTVTRRDVRIRSAAKLRQPAARWVMDRQPKSPEELDTKAFICIRCGRPMAEGAEGFISAKGFPVHVRCGKPGELQEYKDANGGNGYRLNPKYFPAWYRDDRFAAACETPAEGGA